MLTLNWYVATGVLLLEIALLGKLVSLFILKFGGNNLRAQYMDMVKPLVHGFKNNFNIDILSERTLVAWIFIFSLFSSIMTLVYSELFLQVPCALCWFQRIFMYGIVILSGLPLLSRWTHGPTYSGEEQFQLQLKNIFIFSVFGFLFGLYQHAEQILALYGTHLPCPVSGADCAKMTVYEYGHITFPWMAVVLFAFFIIIILLQKEIKKNL